MTFENRYQVYFVKLNTKFSTAVSPDIAKFSTGFCEFSTGSRSDWKDASL